ncbi:MAG TPA: hypothetical protein GX743_02155 [Actinomycetales bacterium]|nr:hypothetical protein [Actinomycetales bacterium]
MSAEDVPGGAQGGTPGTEGGPGTEGEPGAEGEPTTRGEGKRVARPVVVMETALPVKFAETIQEAVGMNPPVPERFAGLEGAERHVVHLANDVDALKDLIRRHTGR